MMRLFLPLLCLLCASWASSAQVTSISASTTNDTYDAGDIITIVVTFDSSVTAGPTTKLQLAVGRLTGDEAYAYGTNQTGNSITLDYIVRAGDNAADLDYTNNAALSNVTNMVGNLPAPGTAGSLGANKDIVIDTIPLVRSVSTSLAGGTYAIGQSIPVQIAFSEPVTISSSPTATLALQLNSSIVNATYTSGSGTRNLIYSYTVQTGDTVSNLDYASTNALILASGTTLRDAGSRDATLTLPVTGTSTSLRAITIDATPPSVVSITSTAANGSYKVGDSIPITVQFSESVTVTGTPTLSLSSTGSASYLSGSGSANLLFTYVVGSGQSSADLDVSSLSLTSASIRDTVGNSALASIPSGSVSGSLFTNKDIRIAVPPQVSSVDSLFVSPATSASQVDIRVQLSSSVTVGGITTGAKLTLETGTTDRDALLITTLPATTNILTFRYTVQSGDNAPRLDYVSTSSLNLSGLTFDGLSALTLALPTPGTATALWQSNIKVDTTLTGSPTFAATADSQVATSNPIIFNVTTNEATTGFAASDLTCVNATASLTTVGTDNKTYQAQLTARSTLYAVNATSGGATVVRMQARGTDVDLTAGDVIKIGNNVLRVQTDKTVTSSASIDVPLQTPLTSAIAANSDVWQASGLTVNFSIPGSAATDLAGNGSVAFPTSPLVTFDPVPPVVTTSFSASSTGLTYDITFSEDVGDLAETGLSVTGGVASPPFQGGDARSWFVVVTPDGVGTVSLQVQAGAVNDLAGNPNLAGSVSTYVPLAVTTVVAKPQTTGTKRAGDVVDIEITLNRSAAYSANGSNPLLALETGENDAVAELITPNSDGPTSKLTFRYTVGAGENVARLDYASPTAISFNGATLDGFFELVLPPPGQTGSLGSTSAIVIDTTGPTVLLTNPGTVSLATTLLSVVFSEPIAASSFTSDDVQLTAGTGSVSAVSLASDRRSAQVTILFTPTTPTEITVSISAGALTDQVGNATNAAATTSFTYDPSPPSLALSGPIADRNDAPLPVTINASKPVSGLAGSDFSITNGVTGTFGSISSAPAGTSYQLGINPISPMSLSQAAATGVNLVRIVSTTPQTLAAQEVIFIGNRVYRLASTEPVLVGTTPIAINLTSPIVTSLNAGSAVWSSRGTLISVSIPANSCQDTAARQNAAVAPISFRYDPTPPQFDISVPIQLNSTGQAVFNLTPNEPVDGLSSSGLTVSGGTIAAVTPPAAGSDTWTVAITPIGSTSIVMSSAAGAAVDRAGNPSVTSAEVTYAIAPQVTKVTARNANGTYGLGIRLRIQVEFSEPVTVTGTPTLLLGLGLGKESVYVEGSGTAELLFDYTVSTGDVAADLDYYSSVALATPLSTTIRDVDGNKARLTLPAPGAVGSLSANANLKIDTGVNNDPAKPDVDGEASSGGGCGAGSGIALALGAGWLGLSLIRRRRAA